MKEFIHTEARAETAVLVALITKTQDERKTNEYLDELEFLAETAGNSSSSRYSSVFRSSCVLVISDTSTADSARASD